MWQITIEMDEFHETLIIIEVHPLHFEMLDQQVRQAQLVLQAALVPTHAVMVSLLAPKTVMMAMPLVAMAAVLDVRSSPATAAQAVPQFAPVCDC